LNDRRPVTGRGGLTVTEIVAERPLSGWRMVSVSLPALSAVIDIVLLPATRLRAAI
jgi:hypothetical protein